MLTENQKELLRITKEKELLKQREERLNYYGILDEYQLHPKDLIQDLSYRKLNPYQHF